MTENQQVILDLLNHQKPYLKAAQVAFPLEPRFVYFQIQAYIYLAIIEKNKMKKAGLIDASKKSLDYLAIIAPKGTENTFHKLANSAINKVNIT